LTWSFYLFCIGAMMPWFGSYAIAQTVPMPFGFIIQIVRVTLLCVGVFAGLDFALRFPTGQLAGWRRALAFALPFFAAGFVAWEYLLWFSLGTNVNVSDPFGLVDVSVKTSIAVFSIAAVVGTYLSSASGQRQRMKWAVIGISLGYSAIAGHDIMLNFGLFQGILQFVTWCFVLAAFLAPLSVAYAIARHRVIDVRFVLSRGFVYLILTLALAAAVALTYWTTNVFLQRAHVAGLVQFSIAILAGVILMRLYSRMESGISRLFFRQHHAALQQISSLSAGLGRAESLGELERLVASEPAVALDLVAGGVYRQTPNGWYVQVSTQCEGLPTQLGTDDPLIARMRTYAEPLRLSAHLLEQIGSSLREQSLALALPLYVDGTLYSVVLYGAHVNGSDLDPQEVSAIVALQRPAELPLRTLLERAKHLRELADLIAKAPPDVATDPYDYLSNQFIDALPPRTRAAVVACASIPGACVADINNATEDRNGSRLISECPPLSSILRLREAKTFEVHNLVTRAIERRFPEHRQVMLGRCGRASAEIGDHSRAAQLLQLAGLHSAAASELETYLSQQDPEALVRWTDDGREYAYNRLAADIHPNSWIAHSASRLFRDSPRASLNDGRRVANVASEAALRAPLLMPWLAYLQAEAGQLRAGGEALCSLPTEFGPTFALEFTSVTRALFAGRLGNISCCASEVDRVATTVVCRGLRALIYAAHVKRMQGDWNGERSSLDSAIETLRAARSRFVVWALAEAVTGAWLAGDEHARLGYADALHVAAKQYDALGFVDFAAMPSREQGPMGWESPRWLALAHLRAACDAETWEQARDSATRALVAATDTEEPFVQVLAHLACAEFDENARQEHFRHALSESCKVDSPVLASAVRAVISNEAHAGMLMSFVMNLRKDRDASQAALVVEVTAGRVRRGRLAVALSERELAVVLAIARSQNATPGAELADLIWPDLDDSAGSHAVQTCMHRLRQRLRDAGAVEKTAYGYRLRDGILVDLSEIEVFVRGLQGDDTLDEFTALRLAALAKQLDVSRPAFMAEWEWFSPIERRIEECWRFARYRLAFDAFARHEFDRTVNLAQSIILRDELDEPAWELVIRALVEKDDRAAAQRELRRYREITLRELNAQPPPHLYALVESAPEKKWRLRVVGDQSASAGA
jgi:DNA-binding SARP family transcriptional activator